MQRFFGAVEVAEQADQGGENATRLGPVDLVDDRTNVAPSPLTPFSLVELLDRPHLDGPGLGRRDLRRDL